MALNPTPDVMRREPPLAPGRALEPLHAFALEPLLYLE